MQRAMQFIMPRERVSGLAWAMERHPLPSSTEIEHRACCAQGDARDWALMWTSVAIFVYMAMHMYRLYAHMYYAAGLRPIMQTLFH
jgi:hypothetical protein